MFLFFTIILAFHCGDTKDQPDSNGEGNGSENGNNETEAPVNPDESGTEQDGAMLELFDFPNGKIELSEGQKVFAPLAEDIQRAKDTAEVSFKGIFGYGVRTVESVGDFESVLKDFSDSYTIPNAYILPLPMNEEVSEGDLLLASRYGNSIEHAYVVDASDPNDIKANFINVMPYGENIASLKPNQYARLDEPFEPGSVVAIKTGSGNPKRGLLIAVSDTKVLTRHGAGTLEVHDKANCISVPSNVSVAVGDSVFAVWSIATFRPAVVKNIDTKLGFYEVQFENDTETNTVPFGELLLSID